MIEPRNVAAFASALLLGAAIGCTSFYEIPIETPIQPKMDVTPFSRVLVAGFIGGGSDDVDANLETVRLLRSQLRSKSSLRVIEAEVLPLEEIAREQAGKASGTGGAVGPDATGPASASTGGESQSLPPVPQLPTAQPTEPQQPAAPAAPSPAPGPVRPGGRTSAAARGPRPTPAAGPPRAPPRARCGSRRPGA